MKPDYCFIISPRRTGSTLLMSLLDGHPQLNVWPGEFLYWFYLPVKRETFFVETKINANQALLELLQPLQMTFREYKQDLNEEVINWEQYIEFAYDLLHLTEPLNGNLDRLQFLDWLFSYVEDYFHMKQNNLRVMKCMQVGFDWEDESLKNYRLIFTYRKPEYTFLSWKKMWMKHNNGSDEGFHEHRFDEVIKELRNDREMWEMDYKNRNIHVVHLEKLRDIRYFELELLNLCEFLNIDYHKSLTVPTIGGKRFIGFHVEPEKNTGIIRSDEHNIGLLEAFELEAIKENSLYL